MTSLPLSPVPSAPSVAPASAAEPRARFRDLVASEWLRLRSLRSTGWALLLSALVVVAFNVGTAWDHSRYWHQYDAEARAGFLRSGMALSDAFTANASMVLAVCAGAMGAMAVVGDHAGGLARTVFAAVPARSSLMAAKVLVVAAVQTVFGAVAAGTSFWLTQAVLSGRGAGLPLSHPGALRIVVASALLAPVCALSGMALGALLRRAAASVLASVAVLLILPMMLGERRYVTAVLAHGTPVHAWRRLAWQGPFEPPFPWTQGGAWTVYALWAVGAAAVTVAAVRRRDQ
ncbi:ABC transporter permease subunit [Streptomyces griseus]|uniref:ABC transporter permease subunit n=1 Tax=Streptomyces griseus TaxID=1911 RepID=UPI0004CC2408|nr:ABC transporter permease subunit [Streptomyces griseus]